MSSTFSEMISYLKPLLSESDYNRLNHDLNLRESSWKRQNDIHYHRIATLEGHILAMSQDLKDYSVERGELRLSNSDLEQKVTELNSELAILRGELNDDYELKLAELKKEVQILNKQCLNWSEENRDLKEEIGKLEARAKETGNMYEKIKQNLELEKGKTVELEKKKREAEEKYEALLLAGTKKHTVLEDEMVEIEQTGAELLSGPQANSSINVNEGQQTNAQETIPCLQKASITSPPIVDVNVREAEKRRRGWRRKKYRVSEVQMGEIEQTGAELLSGISF